MNLNEIVHRVSMMTLCENVYIALDGTVRPTPYAMPAKGMWYFDGQFFYHEEARSRLQALLKGGTE